VDQLLAQRSPRAIVHFAAESHVDRSIHGPGAAMRTNVEGTFTLLEPARAYWSSQEGDIKANFCIHHFSTERGST
jgi:dTDP-glucose 4,6-dehydratase